MRQLPEHGVEHREAVARGVITGHLRLRQEVSRYAQRRVGRSGWWLGMGGKERGLLAIAPHHLVGRHARLQQGPSEVTKGGEVGRVRGDQSWPRTALCLASNNPSCTAGSTRSAKSCRSSVRAAVLTSSAVSKKGAARRATPSLLKS